MKYPALIAGIAIISSIWLSGLLGLFKFSNAFLYDFYVRLTPEIRITSTNILLIEADESQRDQGDEIWLNLLKILKTMNPYQIIFTFIPENVSNNFWNIAETYPNIIFGYEIDLNQYKSEYFDTEPNLNTFLKHKVKYGLAAVPPAYYGIHRYQFAKFVINGKTYLSCENTAAKTFQKQINQNSFLVNFNGKFNGMPRIDLSRVLEKNIVYELASGQHVIIGFKKSNSDSGLHTPITPENGMSMLEFHSHALDTLLSEKSIIQIDDSAALLIISILVFSGLILYQFMSIKLFSWFFIPIGSAYLFITWAAFSYLNIWLPISKILMAHILTFGFISLRKSVIQEKTSRQMFIETSVKLREKVLPESFYDSEEYWTQIINMVKQILGLNRAIFLEAVQGDHRVKEISALYCSLSDINERRRDFQRTPYITAIEENRPIKIKNKSYLKQAQSTEDQYLVALMFGTKVLGFWAFGIEAAKASKIENFNSIITDFAGQISELLYRREHKRLQEISSEKKFLKYLSLKTNDAAQQGLKNSIIILERRFALLEAVFDAGSTAVVLYNLFGQILHVNKNMLGLMTNSGFILYKMTAVDLVRAVTNLGPEEIQHFLRKILFDKETISLPAMVPCENNKNYMLHIRPLIQDKNELAQDDAYPFETYGILFELLEITELKMFNQLKDQLFGNINYHFRRDFEPVMLACSMLEQENVSQDNKKKIFDILYRRIDKILNLINHVKEDLLKDMFIEKVESYPIDPKNPLQLAVKIMTSQAQLRRIKFIIDICESSTMVCAGPDDLVEVIKSILDVLIKDALDNTLIKVDMIEVNEEIIYSFSNTGFGMPNDIFQGYIFEDSKTSSPAFKKLRNAVIQVQKWGGRIRAVSQLGVGIHFNVHLESGICQLSSNSKKPSKINTNGQK